MTTNMTPFAAKTKVPVEKTKAEIERLLKRYGATGFATAWQGNSARIEFIARDWRIRVSVTVPEQEQASRQKWRALLLSVRAKLEMVNGNIVTFEEAFFADIVLPETGKTVWETAREPVKLAYEGKTVALLGHVK
jgi:hypothetical protein